MKSTYSTLSPIFKLSLLLLLCTFTCAFLSTKDSIALDKFNEFLLSHPRSYSQQSNSEEFQKRFFAFKNSLEVIEQAKKNSPSASFGLTEFSDWTQEEIDAALHSTSPRDKLPPQLYNAHHYSEKTRTVLPSSLEYCNPTDDGLCPPVGCFVGPVGHLLLPKASFLGLSIPNISKQKIIECVYESPYAEGCCGGYAEIVFLFQRDYFSGLRCIGIFISQNPEETYPYTFESLTCENQAVFPQSNYSCPTTPPVNLQVTGFESWYGSGSEIKSILLSEGPVIVYIYAPADLAYYEEGVYNNPSACSASSATYINHAVLLVGYGFDNASASWGTSWGINGYFKLSMINTCGVGVEAVGGAILKPVIVHGTNFECSEGCSLAMLGGTCDQECNTSACSFDYEACSTDCSPHCDASLLSDAMCDVICNASECNWDDGACLLCSPQCPAIWLGDGECDNVCNTASCEYDQGDCSCATDCPYSYVGNGQCNEFCYTPECSYDSGDCDSANTKTLLFELLVLSNFVNLLVLH